MNTQPIIAAGQYDFMTHDRLEWMKLAIAGNVFAEEYATTPDGSAVAYDAAGNVIGVWDGVSQFGYVEWCYTFSPVGEELDNQIIEAECDLL